MTKDVVIIGAGSAGSRLASLLGKNFEITLIEEHDLVGEPVQCAGLVSPRCIDDITHKSKICEINDFVLHSPSGIKLELHSKEPKGVVIDRAKHDSLLAESAEKSGAEIIRKARADKIDVSGGSVKVTYRRDSSTKELSSELAVGAEGPRSLVRKYVTEEKPPLVYHGAQVTGHLKKDDLRDAVEMFLGNRIAPGFFAWKIPADDCTRIGLCSLPGKTPNQLLSSFIRSKFPSFKEDSRQAGIIPIGPLSSIANKRAILIGDAACQTKPLTGGGIYLGKCAAEMLAGSISSEGAVIAAGELYEKRFMTEFGRELSKAWRLRKIINEMSDRKLEKAIEVISDKKIISILEESGDIDYPANLTGAIIRKMPQLMKFLPELVRSGF
ncbi:MAG: NAD(P)/FAD-dependent oxidoreductase [Thermoplasmata archaeon]|nr:NAD(P)/FAD-dependent oxidoreductase [Thermoplasmata archaeon]